MWMHQSELLPPATKLGQGYIFTGICHSVNRGGLPQCMLGDPPARETPPERPPCQGDIPPSRETPLPPVRETPQGDPPVRPSPLTGRPPCQGDPPTRETPPPCQGDPLQAHTQGGNWGGSDPGPHPRGKLRGIRTNPHPRWLLLRTVRILLECILVCFTSRGKQSSRFYNQWESEFLVQSGALLWYYDLCKTDRAFTPAI